MAVVSANSSPERFTCLSARPGLPILNGSFSPSLASNLTINAIRSAKRYQGRTVDCRCASRMRCSMLQMGLTLASEPRMVRWKAMVTSRATAARSSY